MKTLSLFTLLLLLSTSLTARENPFEATNAYEEESARIVEMNEVDENYAEEYQQEQQFINATYEKMNKVEKEVTTKKAMKPIIPPKPALTEEKVKKLIKKAQKESEAKTRTIVRKVTNQPKEIKQVVYVKPRLDIVNEKEILPFLNIEYDNDKIDIHSKYKVNKKLTLPGKKKIILDYTASENFYTKRENLTSTSFLKIAIGNHKKDKFFRVVIELSDMPENYEVTYDKMKVSIVKLYQ
jgi:hypothetical protein